MSIDLVNRLRIKASMIEMGERIAWGSDSELMREAADYIEQQSSPLPSPTRYTDGTISREYEEQGE